MLLSVVVPCYNEAENIQALVHRVTESLQQLEYELVLVDDGSTDNTADLISQAALAYPRIKPEFQDKNRGMAEAWAKGCAAASGKYIVLLDADLQYRPEEIHDLLETIRDTHTEFVQGVRLRSLSDTRTRMSKLWSKTLSLAFGIHGADIKSGFVLCKRNTLLDLLQFRRGYRYWQSFIRIAAENNGLKCVEVPVHWDERQHGKSFINERLFRASAECLFLDLPRAFIDYGPFSTTKKVQALP